MRPKHLKYPFLNKSEKRVFIKDSVLYIPERGALNYSEFKFPGWKSEELFGNDQPVMMEYCSGNGAWITQRAQNHPDLNWVAVEKRFDRVKKIWSKIQNHQLKNLIVIYSEALFLTKTYLPNSCVDGVYINFPDPWPKRHHAKFRLIEPNFISELNRVMKNGVELTAVTDDEGYSKSLITDVLSNKGFESVYPEPYFANELKDYGTSSFEDLWRSQGLTIHYHRFLKAVNS